jgi:hypothetical protein
MVWYLVKYRGISTLTFNVAGGESNTKAQKPLYYSNNVRPEELGTDCSLL